MNETIPPLNNSADYKIWHYGNVKVFYKPHLDGAGTILTQPFIHFIKQHCRYQSFPRIFEWCAGPAFLGFALLAEGMCDHLVVADINPEAIACIQKTIEENQLQTKVTYYLSDNFSAIPDNEQFDLIVGNPPKYAHINPAHKLGSTYLTDLRASDPEWRTHQGFYAKAAAHLTSGGHLFISEIDPYKELIYIPAADRTPYEQRIRPPIVDFKEMIANGGLEYLDATPYHTIIEGVTAWIVCSRKPTQFWKKLFFHVNVLK